MRNISLCLLKNKKIIIRLNFYRNIIIKNQLTNHLFIKYR